jgi:hypothetical protein
VKDRAYTAEEIDKALQTADLRMKVIILLMTSTAERIGSLVDLTLGNITKIEECGIYKIIVYEGTSHEYYVFCTRECASAIDNYLNYRIRCGEEIEFNEKTNRWGPSAIPLLRQQFDEDDVLKSRQAKFMQTPAIRRVLTAHLVRCGLRTMEHPIGDNPNMIKRCRKPVALGNGFRKFAISSFIRAGLNHEIREMLVDHDTHLDKNYFRPSEEEVLEEYMKAEPYLTIDPNVRLTNENKILKIEVSKVDGVLNELAEMRKQMGLD